MDKAVTFVDVVADTATTVQAAGGKTTSGEYNRFAQFDTLSEKTEFVYRVGSEQIGRASCRERV